MAFALSSHSVTCRNQNKASFSFDRSCCHTSEFTYELIEMVLALQVNEGKRNEQKVTEFGAGNVTDRVVKRQSRQWKRLERRRRFSCLCRKFTPSLPHRPLQPASTTTPPTAPHTLAVLILPLHLPPNPQLLLTSRTTDPSVGPKRGLLSAEHDSRPLHSSLTHPDSTNTPGLAYARLSSAGQQLSLQILSGITHHKLALATSITRPTRRTHTLASPHRSSLPPHTVSQLTSDKLSLTCSKQARIDGN